MLKPKRILIAPFWTDSPKEMDKRAGFTLIELLVVIGIIVILASLILPNLMGISAGAREANSKVEISGLVSALTMYEHDNGAYPAHDTTFSSLPLISALKGDSSAVPPKKRYFTFKNKRIKSDGYYSYLDFPYYYQENASKPATRHHPPHDFESFDIWTKNRKDVDDGLNSWD